MPFENLSAREKGILKALINHYISTAEPVGSQVISDRYITDLSPASIRNVLQDLEEIGLIEQPHTSAGRVPTDQGYRLYVDALLKPENLTLAEEEKIKHELLSEQPTAFEEILEQTTKILANVSQQLGVTIAPNFEKGVLTRIQLIPVAERKILVILAVQSGLFRTILLEVDSDIQQTSLEETERVLNERLCGLTLGEIKESKKERLKEVTSGDPKLLHLFLDTTDNILATLETDQIHLGGTSNILNQPEFKDREKLGNLIQILEEKKFLVELISAKRIQEGITITIGKELPQGGIQSCSLLTSTYQAGGIIGTVGVIGPTRMPYSKLIAIVDYTAKLLSEVLSK
ncbi:MAG TPA: heat-inducible transcriptional repressor HrcA [candidate division Zixibacteria bacterium]|nr:heat-inducible transcriptional repressor HrcA [candidate division Zixibacteria bacterium]